jgi:dTMP kinase
MVFVAFEGVEGSGKTTQVARLGAELERRGRRVTRTREPGGTAYGERIRALVLEPAPAQVLDPRAEALLFAAARAQHVAAVIRPAMERGDDVLCDRFVHSSLAYQGVARGVGMDEVESLNRWATGGLWPDLVVLLDIDPKVGLDRAKGVDRFHGEQLAFHQAVRRAFEELAKRDPARFLMVDARAGLEEVSGRVLAAVMAHLSDSGAGAPPAHQPPPPFGEPG